MGLGSVLQTAHSGMLAASLTFDVVSNNIANGRTNGFEALRVNLSTQPPTTYAEGSEPTDSSGGTNSVQIGTGVAVAGVEVDDSRADLGQNFLDMSFATTQMRASASVFDTATSLLDVLVNLGRISG